MFKLYGSGIVCFCGNRLGCVKHKSSHGLSGIGSDITCLPKLCLGHEGNWKWMNEEIPVTDSQWLPGKTYFYLICPFSSLGHIVKRGK